MNKTASAPFEKLRSNQVNFNFVRLDTKALVGAALLGIVFVLVQQIAHRIDALINPASVIIGGITWATFTGLVALLFRQPAGVITGEVQAFVALATGLSPLAPFLYPPTRWARYRILL